MQGTRLQYVTIFLTIFIDILGFGIVIPVLPLYAEHFGARAWEIGALVGVFSLMQFFFAPVWGRISDRVGRKPVLLIGMVGTVLGYLVMGFAGSVLFLFLGRLIDGIAGANIGAAQAYLADISPPEKRARAMGLLGAAFGLGFVFGPALGGWASGTFHYSTPMFIAAGLAAINALFVQFVLPESLREPGRGAGRAGLGELLRWVDRRAYLASLVSYFVVIAGFSMMTTVFALYLLHRFDLDVTATGLILAGVGVIGVVIQGGLIGRLSERYGEGRLAIAGALLMSLGLFVLAWGSSVPIMLGGTVLVGAGNSLLMPSLSSLASRSAHPDWQGQALGILQSAGSLARFAGPVLAGFLLAVPLAWPYGALPLAISGVVLLFSLVGISRLPATSS